MAVTGGNFSCSAGFSEKNSPQEAHGLTSFPLWYNPAYMCSGFHLSHSKALPTPYYFIVLLALLRLNEIVVEQCTLDSLSSVKLFHFRLTVLFLES